MLLISFCSSQNGQNISYMHAIWYSNTTCSTSGQIPVSFGKFRQFRLYYTFRPVSNLGTLKKKKKKQLQTHQSEVPIMLLVAIFLLLFSIFSSPSSSSLLHFSLFFFFFYSFNFLVFCFYGILDSSGLLSFNFY